MKGDATHKKLGATLTAEGAVFSVVAPDVPSLEVVVDGTPYLMHKEGNQHTLEVHGVTAGAGYVYRVLGTAQPLLDPYARVAEIDGDGFRGRVVTEHPGTYPGPLHTWEATVIYETHVRGQTMQDAHVHEAHRGTFRGLTAPHVLARWHRLGVTTIELMPVFLVAHEPRLRALGLTNYWGYSPASFFAIEPRYAADPEDAAGELRDVIRTIHAHGFEVVLDVVYNHTGELDDRTFSWRGLAPYYREDELRNASGCGNVLDVSKTHVRALIVDSLHYLHHDLGVDGVRFDLGALVLEDHDLVAEIRKRMPQLKLIAEPWDAMRYKIGTLPSEVFEWNDRFRDDIRKFFRGDAGMCGALASRYAGSSDVLGKVNASRSVNYLAAHDGFTLADCVAYASRHNRANGEDNRDGHVHEVSSNHGTEGSSDALAAVRLAHVRAMLATLYLSKGIPMLAHGDEYGRTQQGNNNAYCHDSPLTWLHPEEGELFAWCEQLAVLRTLLTEALAFYQGNGDVIWRNQEGAELAPHMWQSARVLVAQHVDHLVIFVGAEACTVTLPEGYSDLILYSGDEDPKSDVCALSLSARSVAVVGTPSFPKARLAVARNRSRANL